MRRSYCLIFAILLASTHATERARRSYLEGRGLGFRDSFRFGSGSDGGGFRGGFGGGLDTFHRGVHGILNKVHEKFSHLGEAVVDEIGGGFGADVGASKNSGQSYGSEITLTVGDSGSSSSDIRGVSGNQGTVYGGSGVFQTRVTGDFGGGNVYGQGHEHGKVSANINEKGSYGSGGVFVSSDSGSKVIHGETSSLDSLGGGALGPGVGHGGSATGSGGSFEGGIVGGQVYGHDNQSASGNEKERHGSGGAFAISGNEFNVSFGGSSSLGGNIGGSRAIYTGEPVLGSNTGFGGAIVGDLDHGHSIGSASANENENLESEEAFVISGSRSKVVHEGVSSSDSPSGGSVSLGFGQGGSGESVIGSGGSFAGGIVGDQVYGHDKESTSGNENGSQGSGGAFVISGSGFNVGHGGSSSFDGNIGSSGAIHTGEFVLGSGTGFGGGIVGDSNHGHSMGSVSVNDNKSLESEGAVVISGSGSKVVHEGVSSSGSLSGGSVSLGFGQGGSGESVIGSGGSFEGGIVGDPVYGYDKESANGNEKGSQGNGGVVSISGSGFNVGHGGSSSSDGNIGSSGAIHTGEFVLGSGTGFGGRVIGNSDHGHSIGSASANKKGSHTNKESFIVSGIGSSINHAEISSLGSASGGSIDLTPGHKISGELGTGSRGSFGGIVGDLGSEHRYGSWSNGGGFEKYRGETGYGGTHGSSGHHGFHGEECHGYSGFGSVGGGIGGGHGSDYGARYRDHSGHRW